MHYILPLLLLFMLSGCNEGGTNTRPYISGTQKQSNIQSGRYGLRDTDKLAAAKIKAEAEKEIARINMEKEILIQELKGATEVEKAELNKEISFKQVEADRHKTAITKDIAIRQDQTQLQIALNKLEMEKWILLIVGLFILALVIFVFYNTNRNRKERLKIHEEKLKQELLIKEQQMRVQIAERLIDAMASGKLTPEQENKLLGAYSANPVNQLPYHEVQVEDVTEDLIEHNDDASQPHEDTDHTKKSEEDSKLSQ